MKKIKLFGFTLNEVMITLGILGVVAALTMPTLNANIQSRKWNAVSQDFVRELEESLKIMNLKKVLAGYTTTKDFVSKLSEYIRVVKICNNDELLECFSDKVTWGLGEATPEEVDMTKVKKAKHFGLDDWKSELIGVQFNNGVNALVAYNPECSTNHLSNDNNLFDCVAMLYDVSGFAFPNQSGKDLKTYGLISKLGPSDCLIEVNGRCFGAFVHIPLLDTATCEAAFETGQYGSYSNASSSTKFNSNECLNKHGAAVIACGSLESLPSSNDLKAMAEILYSSGTIDRELCTALNMAGVGGGNPCTRWSSSVGYQVTAVSDLNGGHGRYMNFRNDELWPSSPYDSSPDYYGFAVTCATD